MKQFTSTIEETVYKITEKLDIPKIFTNDIIQIINDNQHLISISGRDTLIIASIHLVCRINGIPRSLADIGEAGNAKMKSIAMVYRSLLKTDKYTVQLETPIMYLSRVASRFVLKPSTIKYAQDILLNNEFTGASIIIAGSVLYYSCIKNGEIIMQKDIAEASCCTIIAITDWYTKIESMLNKVD